MTSGNPFLFPNITIPGFLLIQNITRARFAVVTIIDSVQNTYIPKMNLFFRVPRSYGMEEIDSKTAQILAIDGVNFTMDIDTTLFCEFVIPSHGEPSPAIVSPAGSRNLEYNNLTRLVPFQPLNNIGN